MNKALILLTILVFLGCGKSTIEKYTEFSNVTDAGCIHVKLPIPIEKSLLGEDYKTGECPEKVKVGKSEAKVAKVCESYVDEKNNDPNVYTYTFYNKVLNAEGEVVKVSTTDATRKCEALLKKVEGEG